MTRKSGGGEVVMTKRKCIRNWDVVNLEQGQLAWDEKCVNVRSGHAPRAWCHAVQVPFIGFVHCLHKHFIMQHCLWRGSGTATTQASTLYNGAFLNPTALNEWKKSKIHFKCSHPHYCLHYKQLSNGFFL